MFFKLELDKMLSAQNGEEQIRQAEKADREGLLSGEWYKNTGLDPMTNTESWLILQIVNRAEKMGILFIPRATLYTAIQEHFILEKFPLSRILFSKDFIFADAIDMYHYAVDD